MFFELSFYLGLHFLSLHKVFKLFVSCVILHAFSSAIFFLKPIFRKKIFYEYDQSVKQFGSRPGPTFVGPGLGPNCLQRLSADDTTMNRVLFV